MKEINLRPWHDSIILHDGDMFSDAVIRQVKTESVWRVLFPFRFTKPAIVASGSVTIENVHLHCEGTAVEAR